MKNFKPSAILSADEIIAAELKTARLFKKISIEDAARTINIRVEYLKALESAQPQKLPPGVYRKNFLREYARFLGLDSRKFLKDFSRAEADTSKNGTEEIFSQQIVKKHNFLIIPKIIRNTTIILVFLVFLSYLVYYLAGIFSSPELEILEPRDNVVVNSNFFDLMGKTESEAQVMINGELIMLEKSGGEVIFTKRISLKKGINIITITASKKYGRQKTIMRQILAPEI